MPKVDWKMAWMKFFRPASLWKWPMLVILPCGLLLEPSPGSSVGASRLILACKRKKQTSDRVHIR
jgi:hypothetical protein